MFTMTGTTGSTFTGIAQFKAGQIGFRSLGDEGYRVRVEPANGDKLNLDGWKQPNPYASRENRYSTVVGTVEELAEAIATGTKALAAASVVLVPAVPEQYIPAVPEHFEIQ